MLQHGSQLLLLHSPNEEESSSHPLPYPILQDRRPFPFSFPLPSEIPLKEERSLITSSFDELSPANLLHDFRN